MSFKKIICFAKEKNTLSDFSQFIFAILSFGLVKLNKNYIFYLDKCTYS